MATATMTSQASNYNTMRAPSNSSTSVFPSSPAIPSPLPFSLPPGAIVQPNANAFVHPHISMSLSGFPNPVPASVPGYSLGQQQQHPQPGGYPTPMPFAYPVMVSHNSHMSQSPSGHLHYPSQHRSHPPPGPHVSKLPATQKQPHPNQQRPTYHRSHSSTSSLSAAASSSSTTTSGKDRASSVSGYHHGHVRSPSEGASRPRTQSDKLSQRPSMLKNELIPDSFIAHGHAPHTSPSSAMEGLPPQAPFMRERSDSGSSSLSSPARRSPAFLDHDDDDTPLALRSRVDSKSSSASSLSVKTSGVAQPPRQFSTAGASERSITPTASVERPTSSVSTARTATPQPPQSSPSAQSGLSSAASSAPHATKDKKTGLDKFKKTYGAGNATPTATQNSQTQQKSHQPTDSVNSTLSNGSSTSAASTSPPATPPDSSPNVSESVGVYNHTNASLSSTTLQSHLDAAVPGSEDAAPRRKKLSLFSSKMNASTDNISISSTMSSASQVLRKIGTFGGKLSKRSSLASIGSMFQKDRRRDQDDTQSEFGISTSGSSSRLRKGLKRSKGSPAPASVSHATVEQESPPTHGSLTPAARLAREQQERYAEQEAKEQEERSKTRESSNSPAPSEDRRLKLIEKEKNKLNKKTRKFWSKGSFGGAQSVGYASQDASIQSAESRTSVDELGRASSDHSPISDGFTLQTHSLPMPDLPRPLFEETMSELDDRTPRQSMELGAQEEAYQQAGSLGAMVAAQLDSSDEPSTKPRSVFEDDTGSFTKTHHAAPSMQSVNESASEYEGSLYAGRQAGREPAPPLPSRAAPRPVRGILKPTRQGGNSNAAFAPHFEGSRSNSATSPAVAGAQNVPPSPQYNPGHQRHTTLQSRGHFLSHETFDSPQTSPSASVTALRGPSPYMNSNANVSEPLLAAHGKPSIGFRSVTSPPMTKRLNFATNLSIHTTWPAGIYDRRGDAATCSRLTPALAQRIKDELNTYKLQEMEVHQSSRIYTHFFS